MRYTVLAASAALGLVLATTSSAQTEPQPPAPPSMASAFASSLGITEAEAERRLNLLEEARQVANKLETNIGNRWGGLRVTNNASTFRVEF